MGRVDHKTIGSSYGRVGLSVLQQRKLIGRPSDDNLTEKERGKRKLHLEPVVLLYVASFR